MTHSNTVQKTKNGTGTIQRGPDLLACIGDTPLLELTRLAAASGLPQETRLLVKAEHLNPGGSGKDRLALALLGSAESRGLAPGDIVVEATSGNTGIALAQACAVKGYRLHVVCSEKVSDEKVRILRAFGATVHRTPVVPHTDPRHYTAVAPRLAAELGGHYLDQFHADSNTKVHETTTGPELIRAIAALGITLDAFVCGVGTSGTLTGVARTLRKVSPQTHVVLADPKGSILADGATPSSYRVEGIGDDHIPALYDAALIDEAITIDDEEAFRLAILAARTEGLLVGGSAGVHLAAAIRLAKELPSGSTIATVLPDTGRNYLTTFLDPEWCRAAGYPDLFETEVNA